MTQTATTIPDGPGRDVTPDRCELVIVSYHSHGHVAALLDQLGPDQRVVVVDNASGADGLRELVARRPAARWVDGRDSGFARGANLGARSSTAEFLVFVNPDSRPTCEVLQSLLRELDADASVGAAAAATSDAAGRIELGVAGWEPTLRRCLVYAVGLHALLPHAGVYARPRPGEAVAPEWITGACLAVRRSTFLELGGFDERYFVYNEDMAYGRAVREAGLRQVLRTDLLVPHQAGSSGGGSTKMPQQRGASMADYLHHHHPRWPAVAMRAVLAAGLLVRALVAQGRGRPEVRRRHTAYVRGIATRRSPYRG